MRTAYSDSPATANVAIAEVRGGPLAPGIVGTVWFTDWRDGTWICAEVQGLPPYRPATDRNPIGPHGFHLHESGSCAVGDPQNPFQATGGHWNPGGQPHGNHAGDLPVLFSNAGYAMMCVYTDKFRAADAVGKTVVIHPNPDDYRTEPAGDSGARLACGAIRART